MSVYHPSEPHRNTLISTGEHRLMMVLTRVLTMRFHSSPSRGTPSTPCLILPRRVPRAKSPVTPSFMH